MITWAKILKLRELLVKASASLSDSDALQAVEFFDEWAADTAYTMGVRVRYDGKLYRCEQSHTSQAHYTPDMIPAIWTEVAEPGTIPVWRQPTGAQDAYMMGDKVHYPGEDDPVYESDMDYNVYAPNVTGWHLINKGISHGTSYLFNIIRC